MRRSEEAAGRRGEVVGVERVRGWASREEATTSAKGAKGRKISSPTASHAIASPATDCRESLSHPVVITFSLRQPVRRRAHALIYPLTPLSYPGREIDPRSLFTCSSNETSETFESRKSPSARLGVAGRASR